MHGLLIGCSFLKEMTHFVSLFSTDARNSFRPPNASEIAIKVHHNQNVPSLSGMMLVLASICKSAGK